MEIRIEGVLKSWNKERGFGFITPLSGGGQDIFVHVSDFPRHGGAPRPGERLSFEIGLSAEGKKKALQVRRPGQRSAGAGRGAPPRHGGASWSGSWLGRLALLVGVVAVGAVGYRFAPPLLAALHAGGGAAPQAVIAHAPAAVQPALPQARPAPAPSSYHCDGRTHCAQMTSCQEATYFLRNCPGVEMDGNHDGVPCEKQWCN